MIKNIILDIGDVLVSSDYHAFFCGKGYDEQTVRRMEAATFHSDAWKELDRGVWSTEEIMDAFVKNDPGIEKELREAFQDTSGFVTEFSYAKEWIRSLKKRGLKVYCLSNWSEMIWQGCKGELGFLRETDGYILSWREKLVKPDPAIYCLLINRYDLRSEECIFIDDRDDNVDAARKLGMCGIVFRSRSQADEEISSMIQSTFQ